MEEGKHDRLRRRVGTSTSAHRHGHPIYSRRSAHASLVRRCAASGLRAIEGAAIVPFTPWTCACCGCRVDLIIAGGTAFCQGCLEASPREDDDDVYQDTGGGD